MSVSSVPYQQNKQKLRGEDVHHQSCKLEVNIEINGGAGRKEMGN